MSSIILKKYPQVALIGRTNVGKSTIFNRLTEKNAALVSNIAGTTRDCRYGDCLWLGKYFTVIDTAGLDVESDADIDRESIKHAKIATKEAAVLVFVVDGKTGLLPDDRQFARLAKAANKPVIIAVNKTDSLRDLPSAAEFTGLGFDRVIAISGKSGSGFGDLLDAIHESLGDTLIDATEELPIPDIKIAIVGRPNVGKSSLFNSLIKEEKAIVSPVPHTTRESQDFTIIKEKDGREYALTFIDTAGIIKKRKINDSLTEDSIAQSLDSLEKSDLAFFVIDGGAPITVQDKNISRAILESGRSLIFIINKWDLVEDKTTKSDQEYIKFLHGHFPYLTWAPVVFTIAKTGARVTRPLELAIELIERQNKPLTEEELDHFLKFALKKNAPGRGKRLSTALSALDKTN